MKIIVTGAKGQLGHAVRKLSSGSDHTFVFTDMNESEGVSRLDITDREAVKSMTDDADVIVNCAAYTDVNGADHCYEVVLLETLPANATEEMITSGFDLSLYTCTPGGASRVTVRCNSYT